MAPGDRQPPARSLRTAAKKTSRREDRRRPPNDPWPPLTSRAPAADAGREAKARNPRCRRAGRSPRPAGSELPPAAPPGRQDRGVRPTPLRQILRLLRPVLEHRPLLRLALPGCTPGPSQWRSRVIRECPTNVGHRRVRAQPHAASASLDRGNEVVRPAPLGRDPSDSRSHMDSRRIPYRANL